MEIISEEVVIIFFGAIIALYVCFLVFLKIRSLPESLPHIITKEEFLRLWSERVKELRYTPLKMEVIGLWKIIDKYHSLSDPMPDPIRQEIARDFFFFGIRWTGGSCLESVFREGWKKVITPYHTKEKVDFSWKCLEEISEFMMWFFSNYHKDIKSERKKAKRRRQRQRMRQREKEQQNLQKENISWRKKRPTQTPSPPWYEMLEKTQKEAFEEI